MKLLLDTHIALWAITDDPKLPQSALALIMSADNEITVSAASIWEISVKHSLGRGNMPVSGNEALGYFKEAGYRLLPVSAEHAAYLESLPPIHADPFDRILIAQAISEPMRFITHDVLLTGYNGLIMAV
ncbi:MAG: type II toxin-antitoxin system VapC family toxin [Nitrospirae bacterium]|nr:type II toxin-antitoxin system VapC family toxin [Nitrospirota bacterium]